jgi:hypothetical protein
VKAETFFDIVMNQFNVCETVLVDKGVEYATHDRLHNFKQAAALQNTTPRKALAGMMAKHTISIYDMIESDLANPMAVWTEKITDHINYLILLKAILIEETSPNPTPIDMFIDSIGPE